MILRCRQVELRLRHTFRLARGASDSRRNLLIEVEEDGLVGYGEAAPIARYRQDAASAARAVEAMVAALEDPRAFDAELRRVAIPDQPAAAAALDMALRDLAAKRMGAPLYQVLGLDPGTLPETSFTIGLDTPEGAVAKVKEAEHFGVLKIKLGSPGDREMLEAVRGATRQRLRVDANEGWSLDTALENLRWLEELGVEMVEQPLPEGREEEMRRLRRKSPLPVFADESVHRAQDIPRLAEAFDGINIKLMKCGGLGEALRMIAVARAHGLKVMLGCMVESSLAITAAAHIAPLVDYLDLDGNLLVVNDPFEGVAEECGRLRLPEGPGLGVRKRMDELEPERP
ncbi:MAG: dipeptide epimerase [Acidobacteria bacterium]|nr:dipeptide epimerase [Acidobacteriota bacterium]